MGGCLCTLRHPTLDEKSNSVAATDGRGSSLSDHARSKKDMDAEAAKSEKKVVTLEDWMKAASPSSNKHSKKKVHPCFNQSQLRRSLISEAQDSLYLDRTMKHHQENEESSIVRSLSCKSQKRVSFKLPHVVIFYNPDEPSCKQASLSSSEDTDCITEDSFPSPNFGANLFDSTEEPVVRLAVEILPRVFVSSRISHL